MEIENIARNDDMDMEFTEKEYYEPQIYGLNDDVHMENANLRRSKRKVRQGEEFLNTTFAGEHEQIYGKNKRKKEATFFIKM